MKYLKKYGRFVLLGIVLLLVSIVLYQNSGAFRFVLKNLFYKKKISLEETVLRIKKVNGISEWITTEYYGETIYSLEEFQKESSEAKSSKLESLYEIDELHLFYYWEHTAEQMYDHIHQALINLDQNPAGFQDLMGVEGIEYGSLISDSTVILLEEGEVLLDSLGNADKIRLKKSAAIQILKEIDSMLGNNDEKKTISFIRKRPLHSRKYRKKIDKKLNKIEAKLISNPQKDLVMLGRGWVKAGFDLEGVEKLKTEMREDTLIISGMPDPHIITSSINPWFIPEKLKGYEIVFGEKIGRLTSQDIKNVKVGCLKKLERKAVESGVLEQAWGSAERSVLSMARLMNHKQVKHVLFKR
ncbi:MAG: DUF4230 domain-containing protein [Bacteroidota bacterium]